MDYSPVNHNKKIYSKHLTIEYKKPLCNSENNDNDNELKSKNSNRDKETLNLFKGIVKMTKRTLNEKQTPETQSNTINNNNNNIFDFLIIYTIMKNIWIKINYVSLQIPKIFIHIDMIKSFHHLLLLNQGIKFLINPVVHYTFQIFQKIILQKIKI